MKTAFSYSRFVTLMVLFLGMLIVSSLQAEEFLIKAERHPDAQERTYLGGSEESDLKVQESLKSSVRREPSSEDVLKEIEAEEARRN
ncbi:MAG: hypothetical protein COT74_08270 [Bdellovibrionales bacterium CG10_big_fil_rev_8_21_14_0_10_45_34]|nr:MAG: hypothetical protein COT74_08270 [Bdellovibrionales bacterium CG10_big_fil_rev_8_21_14_0_10_45_34]